MQQARPFARRKVCNRGFEAKARRPRVCRLYHMVYEGINKEGVHALGLATSADGVKWERKSNEPIFERSPPGR